MNPSFAQRVARVGFQKVAPTIMRDFNLPQQQRLLFFQQNHHRLRRWLSESRSNPTRNKKKIPPQQQQRTKNVAMHKQKMIKPSSLMSFSKQWNSPSSIGRDDASLARYPGWHAAGGLLRGADYIGTLTFALTGTITAAQSGLDIFGSTMVGVITSVGGGTIRDAVFLNRRPFWTEETEYIWMGLFTGVVAFFVWPKSVLEWKRRKQKEIEEEEQKMTARADKSKHNTNTAAVYENNSLDDGSTMECSYDTVDAVLDTLDAIGLSAFAIIGAQNGIRAGMPMLVSAICGMVTATFGGLVRDVLCGRPVRIVHSTAELYASTALAGAIVYLASKRMGGSPAVRISAAFATCMGLRYFAVQNDVKLHTWDTMHDNLGVTVRKHPTKKLNK